MNRLGFISVAAITPRIRVANPLANAQGILRGIRAAKQDILVFPELAITGYTCGDLFSQQTLIQQSAKGLQMVLDEMGQTQQLVIVGAPLPYKNALYNCAFVLQNGKILAVVPKSHIPTYKEFYESRWFRSGESIKGETINYIQNSVPFGTDILVDLSETGHDASTQLLLSVEICEDLWMPIPPSSHASLAGAILSVNLSASPNTVGKPDDRRSLVANQSYRSVGAYVYCSSGPDESSTDLVFSGHNIIAENGRILAESSLVGGPPEAFEEYLKTGLSLVAAVIDVEKLANDRRVNTSFGEASLRAGTYRQVKATLAVPRQSVLPATVDGHPFVPKNEATLHQRCREIFDIQSIGLAKRLSQLPKKDIYIGISGGLDSTLALLVAIRAMHLAGGTTKNIHGITMPGFGTTGQTKAYATDLMQWLDIDSKEINIRQLSLETFRAMGHSPFGKPIGPETTVESFEEFLRGLPEGCNDLTFENVQARERTKILMDHGFVLGTGDLSELALGWCTFNGDHMSMYNVNAGVPKTLVKFLVNYVADHQIEVLLKPIIDRLWSTVSHGDSVDERGMQVKVRALLKGVVGLVISPELLPPSSDGKIRQSTEDILGPYELHDFFLYHFVRNGFSPVKILHLAERATFDKQYSPQDLQRTMHTFLKRFFANQFKRNCVPDGPKVGSVSLSPRGDWRMPSDAADSIWTDFVYGLNPREANAR